MAIIPSITTGTLGSSLASVQFDNMDDADTLAIQITGVWAGTITFEASAIIEGATPTYTTYTVVSAAQTSHVTAVASTTSNGLFIHETYGIPYFRVIMSSYTSGTANITGIFSRTAK
tara:strand:+ start:216 stop:566 length:351 start_codon:yes stop_codon:yes gene_type:complete